MFELAHDDQDALRWALNETVGLQIKEMWRYAGLQRFDFAGTAMPPSQDSKADEDEWSLVSGCDWRVTGQANFSFGSWNFGRGGERSDDHAGAFYDLVESEGLAVSRTHITARGDITIDLSQGFRIEINPSIEVPSDGDQWRIIRPMRHGAEHLVLQGGGFYRVVVQDEQEDN